MTLKLVQFWYTCIFLVYKSINLLGLHTCVLVQLVQANKKKKNTIVAFYFLLLTYCS